MLDWLETCMGFTGTVQQIRTKDILRRILPQLISSISLITMGYPKRTRARTGGSTCGLVLKIQTTMSLLTLLPRVAPSVSRATVSRTSQSG